MLRSLLLDQKTSANWGNYHKGAKSLNVALLPVDENSTVSGGNVASVRFVSAVTPAYDNPPQRYLNFQKEKLPWTTLECSHTLQVP